MGAVGLLADDHRARRGAGQLQLLWFGAEGGHDAGGVLRRGRGGEADGDALGVAVADGDAVAVGAHGEQAGRNSPSKPPSSFFVSSVIFSSSVLMKGTTLSMMSSDATPG